MAIAVTSTVYIVRSLSKSRRFGMIRANLKQLPASGLSPPILGRVPTYGGPGSGPRRTLARASRSRAAYQRYQFVESSVAKELVTRRISSKSSTPTHRGVTRKRFILVGGS